MTISTQITTALTTYAYRAFVITEFNYGHDAKLSHRNSNSFLLQCYEDVNLSLEILKVQSIYSAF